MSNIISRKSRFSLLLSLVFSVFLLMLASCGGDKTGDTAQTDPPEEYTDSLIIELSGVDSLTVFELLRQEHEVAYNSSLQGVFVTAIDSIAGGGGYFWIYEVNDSTASVACDRYMTRQGDKIVWYLRKM